MTDGSPEIVRVYGWLSPRDPFPRTAPLRRIAIGPTMIEVRSLFGRTLHTWEHRQVRVESVRSRVLPGWRRRSLRFTRRGTKGFDGPLYLRVWRFEHAVRALAERGWRVEPGGDG